MSHFAKLNLNNIVIEVIQSDSIPSDGNWLETSFDTRYGQNMKGGTQFRKNFAAVGWSYDSVRDAFIPVKPYASWILNEETCNWVPPVQYPIEENQHTWDESSLSWKETSI